MSFTIFKHLQSKPLLLVFIHLLIAGFLLATVALAFQKNVPLAYMTRDPSVTMDAEPYIGIVSNVGILLWCMATVTCVFSAIILAPRKAYRTITLFLLCSGSISLLFLFDDLLMLHEAILPNLLNISEKEVFLGYAGMLFGYFVAFWRQIIATNALIMGIALGFFGLSIGIDLFDLPGDIAYMLEDSAKFTGIVNWCNYFIMTTLTYVRREMKPEINEINKINHIDEQVDYKPILH
jgi:hypothetical protein